MIRKEKGGRREPTKGGGAQVALAINLSSGHKLNKNSDLKWRA